MDINICNCTYYQKRMAANQPEGLLTADKLMLQVKTNQETQVAAYKTIFIDSFKRLYITVHEADEGYRSGQ